MSTISRESSKAPATLPTVERGETVFGALAIAIGFLALVAQFSGLFA